MPHVPTMKASSIKIRKGKICLKKSPVYALTGAIPLNKYTNGASKNTIFPVSYTHLDVYKRQQLTRDEIDRAFALANEYRLLLID